MPRKSIVVVDVTWEFRLPKKYQISTEVAEVASYQLYDVIHKSKRIFHNVNIRSKSS